ncbi:hypothetical protein HHK36_020205 [Tetracentron sinense]|uniref:Glutathione S-transferase n=1 Tax=Tetracentron sinense TaxID=13715 RepID=A0A835D860_TETSI|nr:hypothetical protein HHK36_020205 [Tetracentron sinense]
MAEVKVPVLVHNGKPIAESLVILDYIEDTWKENPILPENPYDRAMARFWGKFAEEKCLTEVWTAFCTEGHGQEKAVESAIETLRILDKQVKGKKFFGGETIGFLDLVVGWIPHWLTALEEVGGMKILDAETLPSLHEWADNVIQILMIKERLPPMEKVINYFQVAENTCFL